MSQSIQTSVDRTVREITSNQRLAIEELVGGYLAPDQRIFVLAYCPGEVPSESMRSVAQNQIEELLSKAHQHSSKQGVTSAEIDEAISEAIQNTDE